MNKSISWYRPGTILSMEQVEYTVSTIHADFFCNQALDLYQDLDVSRILHKLPKYGKQGGEKKLTFYKTRQNYDSGKVSVATS